MATKVEHNVTAREAPTAIIAERPLTLPHFAIEHGKYEASQLLHLMPYLNYGFTLSGFA